MSVALDSNPVLVEIPPLEKAILETLAYSDVFDYPLTMEDLYRFLTFPATVEEISESIAAMQAVSSEHGYYFLAGRSQIVKIRIQREEDSHRAYRRAIFYGRILGGLPFIRMVALTGSLAMLNLSQNRDMDYMLVAKHGRVWTARAFALLFARFVRLFGDVICPNVIVSENALEWQERNLYTAHEFAQMIPVSGVGVCQDLRVVNKWAEDFLPNFVVQSKAGSLFEGNVFQPIFEFFLNSKLGQLFETWEMNRKIARFQGQAGYGAETNFSADVCQGNFDHHGSWTLKAYEERVKTLSYWEREG